MSRVKRTLKASNVLSAVGLTAKTIPALQWLGGTSVVTQGARKVYSRSLFAIEPQRSAGIVDSETPLRDHRRVGGNWLIVGINAESRGGQPSAWVVETRLSDGLAKKASAGVAKTVEWAETDVVLGQAARAIGQLGSKKYTR
jgi:hypothetical protein